MKFEELNLSQELLSTIQKLGFNEPTEIQELSIPHIISGEDVIGESATGSGKTLAFGCGIMQKAVPHKGLQGLILTPTRELAEQVKDMLRRLTSRLNVIAVYGGVSMMNQIKEIPHAEVVVSTPGRLCDHLQRGTIDLGRINVLVLDEADRMLDMGFIDDVERIIRKCPRERQTMFFSATLPPEIKKLANRYMRKPEIVSAEIQVDPSKLKQVYYDINERSKLTLLIHLIKEEVSGLIMVFCNTRSTTEFVVKNLKANGVDAIAIHGGLRQNVRTNTMKSFNEAKFGVLVCTDVAARGLHIDNVSHVYNYEVPRDPKDYVHRIGRTARAGEEGKVVNLLSERNHGEFSKVLSEYRGFNVEKKATPDLRYVKTVVISNKKKERGGFFKRRFR